MSAYLTPGRAALGAALLVLAVVALSFDLQEAWTRSVVWTLGTQRELHRSLTEAARAVRADEAFATWTLVGLSLAYGVFHAVGPGHGKVVIATYLATQESRLRRGIGLSLLSAALQGVTAIVLVGLTALVLERSLRDAHGTALVMESASYVLVALIGLFLAVRSGRRLVARWRGPDGTHTQGGRDDHGGGPARDHAEHGCGHAHGPTVADLEAPPSLRHFLATALSIGIRPCSGAILVLILAFTMGLPWAGIAAVAAMSLGTGATVSALAALSVYARRTALALADGMTDHRGRLGLIVDVVALVGGLLIITFGLTLLQTSLAVTRHPLL